MFGAVQLLILTLLCVLSSNLVKFTELQPVWERAVKFFKLGLSFVISLFVKICLFIFPFDV